MIGGFDIVPKFKRILHPSEYGSIWVMPIGILIVLFLYTFIVFPRFLKRKFKKR